ncbi:YjdF family protein [Paenibacillus polymyxa]|uniref:YjdF family protein n=1 Tax=Paenibacillus polymyxa TaxID=1406 RepID=UPI0025B6AB0A|nr:YjdF family protein [Paenibacillus polymyxa]MDN4089326.1 YjdF family protein [Paenibacillus polymyxa]
MKLTIYHDGQYWVGVVEEQDQGKLKAARYIFGTEPKDEEILHFIREVMCELVSRLSQEVAVKGSETKKVNPKRLARQAAFELRRKGVSSNAQEALKLEYEKRKLEKRTYSKQQKESMKARIRELKEKKAKEKHRGH